MTGEFTVLVRVILYIAAGKLSVAGLPQPVIDMITNDPGVADLVSQAMAAMLALVVYLWSRIAKRVGWST